MLNKYAFALESSSEDDDVDQIKPNIVTQITTIPITNWQTKHGNMSNFFKKLIESSSSSDEDE